MNTLTRAKTALAVIAVAAASLGALSVTSTANAAPAAAPATVAAPVAALPAAVPAITLSTTNRGWCVKVGTGELRNLWFDAATNRCPVFSPTNAYWGPVALGGGAPGPAGPAGPAGPRGPAGPSNLVITTARITISAGTAGNGAHVVSVAGLPPFSATQASFRRLLVDLNAEALPVGVTASVGAPTAAAGATTWNFPVTTAGAAVATPAFPVILDVIVIPVTAP